MRSSLMIIGLMASALALGCGVEQETDLDENVYYPADNLAAPGEIALKTSGSTVWLDRAFSVGTRAGEQVVLLKGRTSRALFECRAFIFDDEYGDCRKTGERTFEVAWNAAWPDKLLDGVNQFIRLELNETPVTSLWPTLRVVARPRLVAFSGSGPLLVADLKPVLVRGQERFRVSGTGASKIYQVYAKLGGVVLDSVVQTDDTHFQIDLTRAQIIAALAQKTELEVHTGFLDGLAVKKAQLALPVLYPGITIKDPYAIWPALTCKPEVKTCLMGLPADALDPSACGATLLLRACQGSVGLWVGPQDIAGELVKLDARLGDPAGVSQDARSLVGGARVAAFRKALRAACAARLNELQGAWFHAAPARTAALAFEVERVVDRAYARPLELVPALTPKITDAQRTRDVAADGLLAYLASHELRETEYSKTLVELARAFRAQHLESLRFFREQSRPEASTPASDPFVYVGQWLSSLVEVKVDRTTGKVTGVLLEID